ncbi:16S rRNA (guanine(966)-N(2))-methyltransferase RsmD [Thermodesulfovibrionales bacterium]|nr:16S rRNA (guanine(966)-N(2))-methyltransferase RsmD [Thermodesulfovibrionales bacterium]
MRISGGIAKGRKISPKLTCLKKGRGCELRPTSAKVREAIFNILGTKIDGSAFLDLYAGTGAVGIEALSRGAATVVFVDDNHSRVRGTECLIEKFGVKDKALVIRDRACRFSKKTDAVFDIIFIDPPYASKELDEILPLIGKRGILKNDGVVVVEHLTKKTLLPVAKELRLVKTYKYGSTSLTLLTSLKTNTKEMV